MIIEVKDNVIITEWWTSKEEEDGKKQITEETVHGKNTVSYTHLTLPTKA